MEPVERERDAARRRLCRMARRARHDEHRRRRDERAQGGEQLGDRAVLAVRAGRPRAQRLPRRRTARSRARDRGSRARSPTRRRAARGRRSRTPSGARTPPSPAGGRRDREEPDRRGDREPERDAPQARVAAAAARAAARARSRKTNRPIADMTEMNTTQRAATRLGVAAVSEIDGTGNWGAGPGVRADGEGEEPAHRVAVDRDRAPVDEVPALRHLLQRHDQRVRVARRPVQRPRRDLVAGGVGDGDRWRSAARPPRRR